MRTRIQLNALGLLILSSSLLFSACGKTGSGGKGTNLGLRQTYPTPSPSVEPSPSASPLPAPSVPAPVISLPASPSVINRESLLTLSGTCLDGNSVALAGDDLQQTPCIGSNFTFTVHKTTDGIFHFRVIQKDDQSNESPPVQIVWIRDTTPPSAPVILVPSASPYYSKSNQLALNGSCEEGASVQLTGDFTDSTLCTSNAFSFTLQKDTDGTFQIRLSQTDPASNVSGTMDLNWTLDRIAPPAPVIASPSASPYTSSESTLSLTGSCENFSTVLLSGDASQSMPCAGSAFSFSVPKTGDGIYNFAITQQDLSANLSPEASVQWIRDTLAPNAPVILSPSASPFYSNGSTLTITGTCENSATVLLSGDATGSVACSGFAFSLDIAKSADGTYNFALRQSDTAGNLSSPAPVQWIRKSTPPPPPTLTAPAVSPYHSNASSLVLSGTCIAGHAVLLSGDDTQSAACPGGTFSFTVGKSTDATFTFNLVQRDLAGNVSSSLSQQWKRDTVAPAKVTLSSPSANPYLSGDTNLTLSGTCESEAVVHIQGDASDNVTCASSSFSLLLNKNTDGTYNFTLNQTDAAGNVSQDLSFQWMRDTAIPPAPTITIPATNPFYSSTSSLVISGGCVSGNTVFLSGDDSQTQLCTASTYSFTSNKSSDGTYNFSLEQETPAHMLSSSINVRWIKDTQAPAAVTVTQPISNPFISGDTNLILSGQCETGSNVALSGAATANTGCVSSHYQFSLTQNADGVYSYTLLQTDAAGNSSSPTVFQWTRDTTIPPTPSITSPALNPVTNNLSSITLSGGCTPDFIVSLGGSETQSTTCSAGSTYSFTVSRAVDGTYPFTLLQTNNLTEIDSSSIGFTWIRDTLAPAAPVIDSPATNPYVSSSNMILSGHCETGATVNLSGAQTQATACSSGTFSFTVSEPSDGTYNFTITQTDAAANVSPGVAITWQRDSSIPPTPAILTPAVNPLTSNASNLVISGSCINDYTVTLGGNVTAEEVASPAESLTQPCSGSAYSFTVAKTADGSFQFSVKQTSFSMIDSAQATAQWIRDTAPPVTQLLTTPPATNFSSTASFTFNSEAGATLQCSLDGGAFTTCTSPQSLTGLGNGSHTFAVRAIDVAGNTEATPPSYAWTQMVYNTIALYHFNTATGALTDSSNFVSPHNNPLTDNGSASLAAGKYSEGRDLSSGTSFLATSSATATQSLLRDKLTIEAWVKLAGNPVRTGKRFVIASKRGAAGQVSWEFGVRSRSTSSNTMYLYFVASQNGTATTEYYTSLSASTTSAFQHYAVTWDKTSGTVKLYSYGTARTVTRSGTALTVGTPLFDSSEPLMVGAAKSSTGTLANYLTGYVDELRCSAVVRTISLPTGAFTAD